MATLLSGWADLFLSRSQSVDGAGLWSNNGGGTFAVGNGSHSADIEWSNYSAVARTFNSASRFMGAGIEGRTLLGGGAGGFSLLAPCNGVTVAAVLKTNSSGGLELWYGNLATQLGVGNVALANGTYYTIEFFYGAAVGVGNGRSEVRVNGVRVPELTTTNFTASGGQPAGTLNPTTAGGGLDWGSFGAPDKIILCPFAASNGPPIQYFWQKHGASLWQTLSTGSTTYASDASDFVGAKRKAWVYPNAVGNYTMPAAGSGTQTSNWGNGLGTYPASVADQPGGMDSDTSYIQNSTNGSSVAGDKISHKYVDIPSTAVTIGWVQRTVWGRLFQASTANIRSGLRSPSTATPANTDSNDATAALSATYGVGTPNFALSTYYPRMPYTVGGSDIWTPATVGNAAGGATPRIQGVVEMLSGLA